MLGEKYKVPLLSLKSNLLYRQYFQISKYRNLPPEPLWSQKNQSHISVRQNFTGMNNLRKQHFSSFSTGTHKFKE